MNPSSVITSQSFYFHNLCIKNLEGKFPLFKKKVETGAPHTDLTHAKFQWAFGKSQLANTKTSGTIVRLKRVG